MEIQNIITDAIDGIGYQKSDDGEIFLNLKDVAIGLGFERERIRNGNTTKMIRWDRIREYLIKIDEKYLTPEVGPNLFISESDFYGLALMSQSAKAKEFRNKVIKEILPAIRKHGAYISENATAEQLEHLLENQIVNFYTEGGERSAQRIRQLIFAKNFDTLSLIQSFNYIYRQLPSANRRPFILSFKYALDESYDRALTGDDRKMKRLAMEGMRTRSELLYRIENQHHQRDNRSYGQKLRHAQKEKE